MAQSLCSACVDVLLATEASPGFAQHPVREKAGYKNIAIPWLIHGDGVPIVASKGAASRSATEISWFSQLARALATLNLVCN